MCSIDFFGFQGQSRVPAPSQGIHIRMQGRGGNAGQPHSRTQDRQGLVGANSGTWTSRHSLPGASLTPPPPLSLSHCADSTALVSAPSASTTTSCLPFVFYAPRLPLPSLCGFLGPYLLLPTSQALESVFTSSRERS